MTLKLNNPVENETIVEKEKVVEKVVNKIVEKPVEKIIFKDKIEYMDRYIKNPINKALFGTCVALTCFILLAIGFVALADTIFNIDSVYEGEGSLGAIWNPTDPGSFNIGDIGNVDTSGVADSDILIYDDGTATWLVGAQSGGGGGDSLWTAADGIGIYYSSSTAPYVGIGTTTPSNELVVIGDIEADDILLGGIYLSATSTGHTSGGELVGIPTLGTATNETLHELANLFSSAGRSTGGTVALVDATNYSVTAGTGFIKATDSDTAEVLSFDWAASSTVAMPADSTRYAGVVYNSGVPKIDIRTADNYDLDTEFPLAKIVRENGDMHILNNPWWVTDGITNVIERFEADGELIRDKSVGGLILSVTGTRNISVTTGTLWSRLNEFPITAVNTAVSGDVDYYWYNGVAGTWNIATTTQYSVTQWNDTSLAALQTLTNNWYANIWVYAEADDDDISILYPQAQYANPATAEADAPPTVLPVHISENGILVGRILIKQEVDAPVQVQSAFATTFTTAQATDHGNLAGLADDDHTQYALVTGARTLTELRTASSTLGTVYSGVWNGTAIDFSSYTNATGGTGITLNSDAIDLDIGSLDATSTILDADVIANENTSGIFKATWTTIKAFLKTYFDGLYLNDDGDTGTGVFDFGGATSFEIPNGASPTVDTDGEIGIDTTAGQLVFDGGATVNTVVTTSTISVVIASSSTATYEDVAVYCPPEDITITHQLCKVNSGTSIVMNLSDGTNDMDSITCATTLTHDYALTNNSFTKNECVEVEFGTNTGSSDVVSYFAHFTRDRK